MKVKDVICEALRLVGRNDAADAISAGSELTDEVARLNRACLTYLNAVFDELARGYFPLDAEEDMSSRNGTFPFSGFSRKPLEIKRVTEGGKPVKWHISPDYLIASGNNIRVYYTYVPSPLTAADECEYPVFAVGERLIEYGIAAEYFLVLGDATSSAVWEDKYRREIENLLFRSPVVKGRIPPRRWI